MVKEIMESKSFNLTTALIGIVILLLTWNVKTTQEMSVQFAVLQEQVVTLTSDRYTGTQASARRLLVDSTLADLKVRMDKLEDAIRTIQN